ncbi:hypothetical protein [Rhodococcus sp. (in: high G+C Gram-positive bacteria)]|uniref:hypothetical protein n=1 Tax=Rhodococcus sp. TaxID=1831 RepID=UPI003B8A8498
MNESSRSLSRHCLCGGAQFIYRPGRVVVVRGKAPTWDPPANLDPATSMGAYYPTAAYCSTSVLAADGYAGCLRGGES